MDEIPLLAIGAAVLRHRRLIIALAFVAGVIGLAAGLLSPRVYAAQATFVPQGSEGGSASGLAAAASQFGIRVPSSGGTWGPPLYSALLRSRTLLERIAVDTVTVAEEGGKRTTVMELLEVVGPTPERRMELAVRSLKAIVKPGETKGFEGVTITVTTKWPSVSLAMVNRLIDEVNQFNLQTRKSQATAERQLAETQVASAERELRDAANKLLAFLQQNRGASLGSPEVAFAKDRLQQEVTLRQQVYNSLVQGREEARLREVRDTPVITVFEAARLPTSRESRGTVKKAIIGGFIGALLGMLIAFVNLRIEYLKRSGGDESLEFLALLRASLPAFLRHRLT